MPLLPAKKERLQCFSRAPANIAAVPVVALLGHPLATMVGGACPLPSSEADFHLSSTVVLGEVADLFTDASCLRPAEPVLRLAAWAVVLARDAQDLEPCVVSARLLPGLVQTAFRAEIPAACSALLVPAGSGFGLGFGVTARVRALLEGSPLPPNCANADLWGAIVELLPALPRGCLVQKVPAHEDIEAHDDPVSFRVVHSNTLADSVATQANLCRDDLFWDAWNELAHLYLQTGRVTEIMRLHVAVARRATGVKPPRAPAARFVTKPDVPPLDLPQALLSGHCLWSKYGRGYVESFSNWLQRLVHEAKVQRAECRWISIVQLFFGFVVTQRQLPRVFQLATKTWARDRHAQATLARRVQWFTRHMRDLLPALGGALSTAEGRPESSVIFERLLVVPLGCWASFVQLLDSRLVVSRLASAGR